MFCVFYSTDQAFVRASITPHAVEQCTATLWLQNYFAVQGDVDPNSQNIAIQVELKNKVYGMYVKDMKKRGEGDNVYIDEKRFNLLWNVLFPNVRTRPYCDIPGETMF